MRKKQREQNGPTHSGINEERIRQLVLSGEMSLQTLIRRDAEERSCQHMRSGLKRNRGASILVGGIFGLLYSPLVGVVTLCIALRDIAHMKAGTMERSDRWKVRVGCFCAILAIAVGAYNALGAALWATLGPHKSDTTTAVLGKCVFGGLLTSR